MASYAAQKLKKPSQTAAFSSVLIKLLQGFVVSDEKKHWESLLIYQDAVRDYFAALGLQLHLSTDDGYAFLKQGYVAPDEGRVQAEGAEEGDAFEGEEGNVEEASNTQFPTLVRRMPLSFDVSFLCVLLREALEQFDSKVNDDQRLVLHRADIYDLLKLFYGEKTDETKQVKRFDVWINRLVELGFLKELKGNQHAFEVRRIIKAQFDAEKLVEIKACMLAELGVNA